MASIVAPSSHVKSHLENLRFQQTNLTHEQGTEIDFSSRLSSFFAPPEIKLKHTQLYPLGKGRVALWRRAPDMIPVAPHVFPKQVDIISTENGHVEQTIAIKNHYCLKGSILFMDDGNKVEGWDLQTGKRVHSVEDLQGLVKHIKVDDHHHLFIETEQATSFSHIKKCYVADLNAKAMKEWQLPEGVHRVIFKSLSSTENDFSFCVEKEQGTFIVTWPKQSNAEVIRPQAEIASVNQKPLERHEKRIYTRARMGSVEIEAKMQEGTAQLICRTHQDGGALLEDKYHILPNGFTSGSNKIYLLAKDGEEKNTLLITIDSASGGKNIKTLSLSIQCLQGIHYVAEGNLLIQGILEQENATETLFLLDAEKGVVKKSLSLPARDPQTSFTTTCQFDGVRWMDVAQSGEFYFSKYQQIRILDFSAETPSTEGISHNIHLDAETNLMMITAEKTNIFYSEHYEPSNGVMTYVTGAFNKVFQVFKGLNRIYEYVIPYSFLRLMIRVALVGLFVFLVFV